MIFPNTWSDGVQKHCVQLFSIVLYSAHSCHCESRPQSKSTSSIRWTCRLHVKSWSGCKEVCMLLQLSPVYLFWSPFLYCYKTYHETQPSRQPSTSCLISFFVLFFVFILPLFYFLPNISSFISLCFAVLFRKTLLKSWSTLLVKESINVFSPTNENI